MWPPGYGIGGRFDPEFPKMLLNEKGMA